MYYTGTAKSAGRVGPHLIPHSLTSSSPSPHLESQGSLTPDQEGKSHEISLPSHSHLSILIELINEAPHPDDLPGIEDPWDFRGRYLEWYDKVQSLIVEIGE